MPTLTSNTAILDAVMNEVRIPVTNTTERAKIQSVLSFVYGDICAKQDWWWLQRRGVINTLPRINTGTVDLTENSTTVTFSTVPQQFGVDANITAYVLQIPGSTPDGNATYQIVNHTTGTAFAFLDAEYTGATATGSSFNLYRVAYALPAHCAKVLQVKRFGYRDPLERIGIEDLSFLRMNNQGVGKPQVYSVFDFETDNDTATNRMLQIHPFPDYAYRMEVWYKREQVGDTSQECDLPVDYQQALLYGALSRCYPIFLNDLERGQYYLSMFNDVMALMSAQQREYASDHPGVTTNMRMYRRGSIRPRVPYTLGAYFDTLPNQP